MKYKKMFLVLLLCMTIIITQTGCGSEEPVSENEFILDTVCTITVYNMKKNDAEDAIKRGFELCKDYEKILSKTVEGSDVYKLNQAKGNQVEVDDKTLEVINKSIYYGELSDGIFDVTIGAVTELWDFIGDKAVIPDESKIQAAVKTVDYKQIKISGNNVSMENPEAKLDLGGIAKGYIADKVSEQMKKDGVKQAVISLGGNIVTLGEKEKGVPWSIGIERPYSDRSEILGSVGVSDGTIVTSGIYERYFKKNGKIYHHVLNPKTGYPVDTKLEAVVIKGDLNQSIDCDALGTVCLMLGQAKSTELLQGIDGIQAAFIDSSDNVTPIKGMKITPTKK